MVNNNRRVVRTYLANLIAAATVGDGKPVAAVYTYRKGNLDATPAIVVSSAGTEITAFTFQGTIPAHRFAIFIFVLYNDPTAGISEEYSEDTLDNIMELVHGVIDTNRKADNYWEALEEEGFSQSDSAVIGGKEYRREVITVKVS